MLPCSGAVAGALIREPLGVYQDMSNIPRPEPRIRHLWQRLLMSLAVPAESVSVSDRRLDG